MLERATLPRERYTLRRALSVRSFADDVRHGLTSSPKELQPWYFYDTLGSALFAAICELPEYYVTRAETEILRRFAPEMARALRGTDRLVEFGSGNCRKTRLLIEALVARQPPLMFVPVDVDPDTLESSARDLLSTFSSLRVDAICADYRDVGSVITPAEGTAVLFLGSSIGNLDPQSAGAMLRDVRRVLAAGDALLLGADLQKAKEIVEPAYNDALGVTAAFNLNILARINRELGGHFDLANFEHRAFLNEIESRIEMHLVSRERHSVRVDALAMDVILDEGETIHTENSYKYSDADLQDLAHQGGFTIQQMWTDSRRWFADVLMIAK
jgi:dimethylhistidine N-methyltransferase